MKYRKMLALLGLVALLGAGQLINAQTPVDPANPSMAGAQERGRGHRGRGEHPRLNLTDDQKAKLKSLHAGVRQQIETLRNDTTLSAADKHEKIRALRASTRSQFQSVLTPEQQQQLQSARQNRGEGRGFVRGGHGRGPGGGGLAQLGLTDAQRSQMQTIRKNTKEQVSAIRNDATLSSEQKEAKLKSLFQSSHSQVSGILTPEQQQKLKEGRHGGAGHFGGPHGRRGGFRDGAPATDKPAEKP
jgi:Spy/CpxP family protein refolding chaperone